MTRIILALIIALIGVVNVFAQSPQAFKYQAVVRDVAGEVLQNQPVGIRMSIHETTAGGTIVYQETFSDTTNDFGLVNIEIGNGTPTIGTFAGIGWGSNSKFLETEIDPAGGSSYVSMGTLQLLSVPFALHAETAGDDGDWTVSGGDIYTNPTGGVGIGTTTPDNDLTIYSDSSYNGLTLQTADNNFNQGIRFRNSGGYYTWNIHRQNGNAINRPDLVFSNGLSADITTFTDRVIFKNGGTVGIGTSDPDASALLEMESTNKGLLPPRMTESQRDAINSPAVGLVMWCTNCGTGGELQVYNGIIWTNAIGGTASTIPEIGDFALGGVVFYLDGNGGGLVCAVSDQDYNGDFTLEWGCYETAISGADGTAIGTGAQNTIDIVVGCTTTGIPANVCSQLVLNGYGDWFLPSKDELNKMYVKRGTINATATANGGTAFVISTYWSSSEYDNYDAWKESFGNGNQYWGIKNFPSYFRAVRAF